MEDFYCSCLHFMSNWLIFCSILVNGNSHFFSCHAMTYSVMLHDRIFLAEDSYIHIAWVFHSRSNHPLDPVSFFHLRTSVSLLLYSEVFLLLLFFHVHFLCHLLCHHNLLLSPPFLGGWGLRLSNLRVEDLTLALNLAIFSISFRPRLKSRAWIRFMLLGIGLNSREKSTLCKVYFSGSLRLHFSISSLLLEISFLPGYWDGTFFSLAKPCLQCGFNFPKISPKFPGDFTVNLIWILVFAKKIEVSYPEFSYYIF